MILSWMVPDRLWLVLVKVDNPLSADFIPGHQDDQQEEQRPEAAEDHGGGRRGAPARSGPQLRLSHHTAGLI